MVNLSGISAGPSNESSQTLGVTASSGNTALIPNPAVTYTSPQATGSLAYTPVAHQYGSALITVTVMDNGGTANGGIDSFQRMFTVVVNPDQEKVKDGAKIQRNSDGTYSLSFIGNPGQQYTIQYCADMLTQNWQFLAFATADENGMFSFVDTPPPGTVTRFYRAIVP